VTISSNTRVVGVAPRISPARFEQILHSAASPAADSARAMYEAIVATGVDPAFALAFFKHESQFGSVGVCHDFDTHSPGNTRSSRIGVTGFVDVPGKGRYVKYGDWVTGMRDACYRLVDPVFDYATARATSIEQILPIWAPTSDSNSPQVYIQSVVNLMNGWSDLATGQETSSTPSMKLKIALSAGHHNTDGGSPVEQAITGPLCHYYADAFRALGHDVRVITPQDGLGYSPIGLQEVAQKVVDWAAAGWQPDLYLETHTQGLADTTVRGCFGIYPDWGNDIDLEVRNGLAARVCQAINRAVGIPIYQAGVMSEKSTGVGISGYRLGIFLVTAPVAGHTTRLIIEHGAHSNPQDRAILQDPANQKKIAQASAAAIVTYFGDTPMTNPTPAAPYDAIQLNGHTLGGGIKHYWDSVNIPGVQHPLGLPITEEQDWTDPAGKKFVIQGFERGILGYDGTVTDPAYRVQGLLIGYDWVKEQGLSK
jgi:N-acetylmuramoyl-L-alanine amidase